MTRREYILSLYPDCRAFARDVLHIPVNSKGRARSLAGQSSDANLALSINHDTWFDHILNVGGGVIELCAWAMFDGDIGRSMQYLAGDFYDIKGSEWRETVERISHDARVWHEKLSDEDRKYLHSRRITDETIERLQLGTMGSWYGKIDHRISIPYFDNGRIVYFIARDRTGFEGAAKYKKCAMPKETVKDKNGRTYTQDKEVLENIPWGLHTLQRARSSSQMDLSEHGFRKRDWLIIAEGAFDAMSFEQEGYCVLATMGGSFGQIAERRAIGHAKEFPNVLVIFDNDPAGGKFQKDMCRKLFKERVNFFTATVPAELNGQAVKDVSDYYCAGGELGDFIRNAQKGLDFLAETFTEQDDIKHFLYSSARFAEKSDVMELFQKIKLRHVVSPFWLKAVYDESVKAPAETVIVRELETKHTLKYIEDTGFFEYMHGVWLKIPDNRVKSYADELLGRYSSNSRMTNIMKFAKARLSTTDSMNAQSLVNLQNGILLPDEGCRFVMHNPAFLSTIQLQYRYSPYATCPVWLQFIDDITCGVKEKQLLLQEIGGYVFFPNNRLDKCFFFIGDGGNGKGVFMDTLRDVFGRENCSALPLSSFGSQFDTIMLQYSLVNFASETRVDLRGNAESIKQVTSGDDITAAHKGVDAVKFTPRCKLITSCNDFFNTGDVTHSMMRRMIFVKFTRNFVQQGKADVHLRDKLAEELPGILNWCIEGYLRLRERSAKKDGRSIFTETAEDKEQKREFMRTTNPVAFFVEEKLSDIWGEMKDTHDIYGQFKVWAETNGYKTMSLGAFVNRIQRVMSEIRPDVKKTQQGNHTWLIFPAGPSDFESIESELENE